jgi:hypothetical protein
MVLPSESLNQAAFAPPAVAMPSRSMSSTCQNAWLAFDVPALGVG